MKRESLPRKLPEVRKVLTWWREFRRCRVHSSPWHHLLNLKDFLFDNLLMNLFFRITLLHKKGVHNALDITKHYISFTFSDLPIEFSNYTILFMTDLHLDGLEPLVDRLIQLLTGLEVDLCLLGGDFRMAEYGSFTGCLKQLSRLIPAIKATDGILSVLGNHDCLDMTKPLSRLGIRLLLNESHQIKRGSESIWIVGVDDPNYYKRHNLAEAFEDVPRNAFTILLVHSPDVYLEGARYGARLYLCGHTHGGQIQIPHIGPILTHSRAPRSLCHGLWEYQGMQGYTSSGVGVSGVPVRFFSRGEIVVVKLLLQK